ncbi:NAD-dependent dehydratase [Pseudoxanthomonas helianthi]|uniref:NAD-dependent dehydratase n=1 Tax=Pseudoxanthomonas helianthi TaxID=1453541 RepID=A0A940X1P8_9GAMM|nr:NAD-dependent dehydratase [Pseudoxanthomonas helianthi]MBP3984279.1 NAD-dependent dehydratase [Pseudoxanthomonas helianthi]
MKILHVGSTGLVGKLVLQRLLAQPLVTQVIAPTRRVLGFAHPRLLNPVVDFDALPEDAEWWSVDAVVCTLGTTIKQAGSKDAFRRVDHDYPLHVARLARARGARIYALNSSVGANAGSSIFYSQVKGELEAALTALDYPSLVLAQPGLIDGHREEHRPGEAFALTLSRALRPLLPTKWRPSRAERIADALVEAALHAPPGRTVIGPERLA